MSYRLSTRFLPQKAARAPHRRHGANSPVLNYGSAVLVINPHNVVFTEIGSALDLYQLERNFAGVGEAVRGACRNVSRLVLLQYGDGRSTVTSAVPWTTTQCSDRW